MLVYKPLPCTNDWTLIHYNVSNEVTGVLLYLATVAQTADKDSCQSVIWTKLSLEVRHQASKVIATAEMVTGMQYFLFKHNFSGSWTSTN